MFDSVPIGNLGWRNANLIQLATQFDKITSLLAILEFRRKLHSENERVGEWQHTAIYNELLAEMVELSWRASTLKAKTLSELQAKAHVWLERHIPDPDDDLACLASSICADIAALQQAGAAS